MTFDDRSFESETQLGESIAGRTRVSRREFMKFCGAMATTLALPTRYVKRIAEALEGAPRPPLVWLEFQDCTGDTESFLRASQPSVDELLLDTISLNYHETIMVPAGDMTERSLLETIENAPGEYIAIVEGSIPAADDGVFCLIRGRTALSIVQDVCTQALATIAVGTCAWDGGLAAADPNPTGAVGVRDAVPGLTNLVALPGCPANVVNLTATLTHFLTFGELPATDELDRPLFAHGDKIHHQCERKVHHDADRFVKEWGDAGHRQGWCLKEMGCRGPKTYHNCPTVRWNDGTNWPIGAGHHCIGCSELNFWDQFAPFYREAEDD
jgi:hydrogenase small subunit